MIEVDKKNPGRFSESKAASLLAEVSKFLTEQDVLSYLVGGIVRDLPLGRDTVDIDIAVAADALDIASKAATALNGKYIPLDKINKVGRVVLANSEASSTGSQFELDFSTFEDNIEQDLARRDFTIDAMAVDLSQVGKDVVRLIDPFNGMSDLNHGVIRTVAETAFESDAVRLLRAVRLAAELNFSIEKKTEALIQRYSHLIGSIAGERVREELLPILAISEDRQLLSYLDELGLLTAMIPELAQTKGVEQPREHFWDVFYHSIHTVTAVDFLVKRGTWEYASDEISAVAPWSAVLARHFDQEISNGSTRRLLLKLAALLHDIAKPQTKAIEANGRMRFLGHAKEGTATISNILGRLRFSTKEIRLVETMVEHHLRPGQMSHHEIPSHRAIYRYFRDTGEAGIDILFLSMADHLATRGPHLNPDQWKEHTQMVEYVLAQREQERNIVLPPKLVDGHDLINIFGMSPSPRIREILESVREAQAAGELNSRQEALSYIECLLTSPLAPSPEKERGSKLKKRKEVYL